MDQAEKDRIREEEEYRASLRAKNQELPKKKKGIGCLTVILIIFGIFLATISAINPSKQIEKAKQEAEKSNSQNQITPSPTTDRRSDFKASVNFTGTQFVIANLDNLDCENAKMEVNGGLFSGGYVLEGYKLASGEIYSVGALQFTKNDGTRLNPYQVKPKTFSIYCSSIGSTNALGGAGWYGEFK